MSAKRTIVFLLRGIFRNLFLGGKPETRDGWRVLYEPDEGMDLKAVKAPKGLGDDEILPRVPVVPHPDLTVPPTRSIELDQLPKMAPETFERFYKLRYEVGPAGPRHRMFGYPDSIQGCMQRTAQFISHGATLPKGVHSYYEHPRAAELMPGARDWMLLLQIDSANDFASWGDWGSLFFWIKRSDLAARNFDQTWFFLQCG